MDSPTDIESARPPANHKSQTGARPELLDSDFAGSSPALGAPNAIPFVALAGNPNSGKTTLFNSLTGLRARVGNYAGVTVERKEGRLQGGPSGFPVTVLDLPGTYSLNPQSPDEEISRDVLFHRLADVPAPELVIVVVDASNLERNLYFATQVIELGYPTFIALNMIDVATENGQAIHVSELAKSLGVPVFPLAASSGQGVLELREKIFKVLQAGKKKVQPRNFCPLPNAFSAEVEALAMLLAKTFKQRHTSAQAEALLMLMNEKFIASSGKHYPASLDNAVRAARHRLELDGVDWRAAAIEARYGCISAIRQAVTTEPRHVQETVSDKLDRIATHKAWGLLIFVAIMGSMFFGIFTLARIPMDALQQFVSWMGDSAARLIPPGDLQNLVVRGMIQGVGAVIVFLPQICLLFLFIGILEDTGYMARAAFLMDRLMSKAGLHGRSFIPLLSSFACAIPGIMATRTIDTPKDRLVTILVAPLMSCSARLPVYVLLIAACFPGRELVASVAMLAMYLLGIVLALVMALIFKRTLFKGETPVLVMELPPYKRPLPGILLRHMWDPAKMFLHRAGTIILGVNIILWFLTAYPKPPQAIQQQFAARRAAIQTAGKTLSAEQESKLAQVGAAESSDQLERSFAGILGRVIEPAIAPLGFDWKIGIGLVSSFAAREMFVSTMAVVYNVGESGDSKAHTRQLAEVMRSQKRADGTPVYSTLTTLTLLVFYALALQCVSTLVVVRRETNSWKWAAFQWIYMGALAWVFAFALYRGGRMLGWV